MNGRKKRKRRRGVRNDIRKSEVYCVELGVKSVAELRAFIVEYGYSQLSDRRKKEFIHNLVRLNCKKVN